jgi:uncharacterized protein (TIGR03437 family)
MTACQRILTVGFVAVLLALPALARPAITTALNSAFFSVAASLGSWITPLSAPAGSLPTALSGLSVTGGKLPPLLSYASPNQVNALIASETAIPADTVMPPVLTGSSASSAFNIRLTHTAEQFP